MANSNMKIVVEIPLDTLRGSVLDITPFATEQRYRFVNCVQFAQRNTLVICESSEFPTFPYSAMSYVWRGNPVDPHPNPAVVSPEENWVFDVEGADGDPISIGVLRHACVASILHDAEYIWLDRLCIMQTSRPDKRWQISHMYQIYKSCRRCMILPGGVRRLVPLDEETAWIPRAWTLQEVLAPKDAAVLFAWTSGSGDVISGDERSTVTEVIPHKSALSPVMNIVNACVMGEMDFTKAGTSTERTVTVNVFGSASPNLAALGVAMSEALATDPDARSHAIWQSALMRTSSRPIDMVLSIMGLFGVSLDPGAFGKDERLRATVALAREILRMGGNASWLGASFRLPLCTQLSTFSMFPETSVAGKAYVEIDGLRREVAEMMDGEYPNSLGLKAPMPTGSMDDSGYLTFSCRAARAVPVSRDNPAQPNGLDEDSSGRVLVEATDGTLLELRPELESVEGVHGSYSSAFAVALGWFLKYYPGATPTGDGQFIKCMLIKEHSPGKFHAVSFFSLNRAQREWVMSWRQREFTVGGPEELTFSKNIIVPWSERICGCVLY